MLDEGVLIRLVERLAGYTLVCLLLYPGNILHELKTLQSQLTEAIPTLLHLDAANCTHFMQVVRIW